MKNFLAKLLGFSEPKQGTVLKRAVDEPRAINYGKNIGIVDLNYDPIYWFYVKDGNQKAWVKVSKAQFDSIPDGGFWKR